MPGRQSATEGTVPPPAGEVPAAGRRTSLGWVIVSRIAIVFLLFEVVQFFLVREFGQRQYQALERTNLLDRTRQVFLAFDQEAAVLKALTARVAMWGDTYEFMRHPSRGYLARNFGGLWSEDNDIDFVLMVGADGRRVWSSDGFPGFATPLPSSLAQPRFDLSDKRIFNPTDGFRFLEWFTGLAGGDGDIWIYCAHAISGYNAASPPRGMLLLGRKIHRNVLTSYMYGHGDTLELVPLSEVPEANGSDDQRIARDFPAYGGQRISVRREGKTFVSYAPLSDVQGRPLAALKLAIPRLDERVGTRLVWLMSGSLFLMVILGLAGVVAMVDSSVIRPIRRLTSFFTAEEGRTRVDILERCARRRDEIGILAQSALSLFEKVEEQKAELENRANTDRLTGLANRHFLEAHIRSEIRRLLRRGREDGRPGRMAVAIADVDHFKLFNDTNGHMAGDACLRAVAEAIQWCIFRPGDMAARFGGEEFILVLPDTDEAGALVVAESVRAGVERVALPHTASPVSGVVTVSVGAASAEVTEGFQVEALIEAADRALYAAKQAGRNRVVGSSSLV